MPSDSKKKRDLQKRTAAKQRQAPGGKKADASNNNDNNSNGNDDDQFDDNDDSEIDNKNESPSIATNGTASPTATAAAAASPKVEPNVKSLIKNLDLLAMVEKANADARACTGNIDDAGYSSLIGTSNGCLVLKVFSEVILVVAMFTSINFPSRSTDRKSWSMLTSK